MKDDLIWILKWIWRHAFQPLFWIGPFVGLVYSNLATQTHPFLFAFWTGPVHFRIVCWFVAVGFLISLFVVLWRRLFRGSIGRDDFYRKTAFSHLSDWRLDAHWLPFDGIVEICFAPNLLEPEVQPGENGWSFGDCKMNRLGKLDRTPSLATHYESKWKKSIDSEKLKRDGTKYVLVNNTTSETDQHFIRLELKETKWSHVQSFLDQIKPKHEGRETLFATADPQYCEGTKPRMDFTISRVPHSLCLHGVVVTTDKKVLALQRPGPEQTDYHPFAWSFSFEEQLAEKDFTNENVEVDIKAWLIRSVRQEVLGDEVDRLFNVDKASVLSVANEEPIFNPFLVAYLPVDCDSVQLGKILPHAGDRAEWCRYEFYSIDPPFKALASAFRENKHCDGHYLHPTSRYRIYMLLSALIPSSVLSVRDMLIAER